MGTPRRGRSRRGASRTSATTSRTSRACSTTSPLRRRRRRPRLPLRRRFACARLWTTDGSLPRKSSPANEEKHERNEETAWKKLFFFTEASDDTAKKNECETTKK